MDKPILPEDLIPVDSAPIIPGVNHNPIPAPAAAPIVTPQLGNYFKGALPSDVQHDSFFVRSGYQTFGAPRIPLMPLSAAGNAQNSAVTQTIVVQSGGSPVTFTGLVFQGTWNAFTNYAVNDVVLSGGALYVAVSSSTNQAPASSPAYWTQLAGFGPQTANTVYAGPTSGADATPVFRLLVAADIPNLDAAKITTGLLALARGGTHADLSATGGASQVLKQISTGAAVTVGQLGLSDISGLTAALAAKVDAPIISAMQFVIDGGGSPPATGIYGQISIPYNCTILSWTITADAAGSAEIDVRRSNYATFPTMTSLAGTDLPTLSSAQKNRDLTLTGWGSTALLLGDEFQIVLNSVTTCTRLNLTIRISIP